MITPEPPSEETLQELQDLLETRRPRLVGWLPDKTLAPMAEVRRHREAAKAAAPIPMVLRCPECGLQHIDAPEPEVGWTNPSHKSHLCHGCRAVWRPADVPTNGVAATATKGERDTWPDAVAVPATATSASATQAYINWYRSLSALLSYWLLRAHQARVREGWEEGPTEEETFGRILDVLYNLELDPHVHKKAVAEMLARPEQCWISAPSAPTPRTYVDDAIRAEMIELLTMFRGDLLHRPPSRDELEIGPTPSLIARCSAALRALKPGGER